MTALTPASALSTLFSALALAHKHIQRLAPWKATASPTEIHRALFLSFESLRISAILLLPFMPDKAMTLLDQLGVPKEKRKWENTGLGGASEDVLEKIEITSVLFPGIFSEPLIKVDTEGKELKSNRSIKKNKRLLQKES